MSMNINLAEGVTAFDHPCKGCGECCSQFLPITNFEIEGIKEYISRNNISPVYQPIMCPFFDMDSRLCKIYQVRPFICRKYDCRKHKSLELFADIPANWSINAQIRDMAQVFINGD